MMAPAIHGVFEASHDGESHGGGSSGHPVYGVPCFLGALSK